MASPKPPSWIILGNVARVSGTDAGADDLPLGADLALALAAPPRVTLLTVPQRVSPDPDEYPMVLALDPSGLLLLSTPAAPTPPPSPPPSSPKAEDEDVTLEHSLVAPRPSPPSSPASSSDGTLDNTDLAPRASPHSSPPRCSDGEDEDDYHVTLNITDIPPPGYYVIDARSAAATRLPDHGRGFLDARCAGLIASPAGDGHYMVVELQPLNGSDEATLLRFSSAAGQWEEKDVNYPPSGGIWCSDAVIAHGGRLCWVDLSWGILSCDPFADDPVLDFVEIPEGKHRSSTGCLHCADRELSTRRCVQVSAGLFRVAELTCGDHGSRRHRGIAFRPWMMLQQAQSRSRRKAPRIIMWTLADSDTGEWKVEHKVSFADIWADESYKETGLPRKAPVLALVHPENPDVVYFFLRKHLFGVNLRVRKVVECEVYKLVGPSRKDVSSRCVRAWELPEALRAGVPSETGSCVNEGSSSVPANDS